MEQWIIVVVFWDRGSDGAMDHRITAWFLEQRLVWQRWSDGSLDHCCFLLYRGSDGAKDHWIDGAKLPQPPHNNYLTPLPHSPQFNKVHQLKFPLHYTVERRIIGSMEQNCPSLHITWHICSLKGSNPIYINKPHFRAIWNQIVVILLFYQII